MSHALYPLTYMMSHATKVWRPVYEMSEMSVCGGGVSEHVCVRARVRARVRALCIYQFPCLINMSWL